MNQSLGRVDARLPLALLQALQQQDEPVELMPNENPGAFFTNSLGVSGVNEERVSEFRALAP